MPTARMAGRSTERAVEDNAEQQRGETDLGRVQTGMVDVVRAAVRPPAAAVWLRATTGPRQLP